MNLTVPVGKGGASAARWKGAFLDMAQEIAEKFKYLHYTGMHSNPEFVKKSIH